jgi:hypothetical protein
LANLDPLLGPLLASLRHQGLATRNRGRKTGLGGHALKS